MNEESLARTNGNLSVTPSTSVRDIVAVVFRQRRIITISFFGTLLGAILVAVLFVAHRYQSEMKILVEHERADPVVTSATSNQLQAGAGSDTSSENEMNSEVELLETDDVLQKVVLACGLQKQFSIGDWLFRRTPEQRIANASQKLFHKLNVEPDKKTNLITVTYASSNPKLATRVLTELAKAYMEKHLEVHRPPGTFDFFAQETEQYKQQLADAEERLAKFNREQEGATAQLERDATTTKLTDAIANLRQTQALIAGTEQRIRNLQAQLNSTPSRITTQQHTADASSLLGQLQSTLLTLELKRTELLTKYAPTYPLVQEVESEIKQTRAAIASTQPFHDETTDRDPTHELLREDLAKAKEDLASLKASETAQAIGIRGYRQSIIEMDQKALVQQDLVREAKAAETNYLLYLNKREQARTTDELDKRRIVNVAIAQAPTQPVLPAFSPVLFTLLGGVFALAMSLGAAFTSDYFNPSFRTPREVIETLDVPLLASVPKQEE